MAGALKDKLEALDALTAMGRDAVPYEIKALGRHDSMWRRMLRQKRAMVPALVAGLLPDLAHPNSLRGAACLALAYNPHTTEFAPQIVRLLDHSDPTVRISAMELAADSDMALQRLAIPAICKGLKDSNPRVRLCAASALGRIRATPQQAVPDLERALEDADILIRAWAAHALLRIRGTNLADGPVKQRVNQIQLEAAQRGPTNVTNR